MRVLAVGLAEEVAPAVGHGQIHSSSFLFFSCFFSPDQTPSPDPSLPLDPSFPDHFAPFRLPPRTSPPSTPSWRHSPNCWSFLPSFCPFIHCLSPLNPSASVHVGHPILCGGCAAGPCAQDPTQICGRSMANLGINWS